MKVLLDTNIIIHREASKIVNTDIGLLFRWLDKLSYQKIIHPLTRQEIQQHQNSAIVDTMNIKLDNYIELIPSQKLYPEVELMSNNLDQGANDFNDTRLINELFCGRVDILITEDKKIHFKAKQLGLSEKVFRIDSFLEKTAAENPDWVDYKVLSVKKAPFGTLDLNDSFFDTLKSDYPGFEKWFHKKSEEEAYVCFGQSGIQAFLYLKVEKEDENYSDITPVFKESRRLKIGTFKVISNGVKLGERFLKIIFDNARVHKVDEIYVTIYNKRPEHARLIALIEEWGFEEWGHKSSTEESVFMRNFRHSFNPISPKTTYPFLSTKNQPRPNRVFIVPIYPEYHTELFPDSILNTESPLDFKESEPHRNAISKSYISHSWERGLNSGDVLVFYRTGETYPKLYSSVATTIGIVEEVKNNILSLDSLVQLSRKRTVLTAEGLARFWNKNPKNRPFVVNFLFAFSFKKRKNLKELIDIGVLKGIDDAPRGFKEISWESFEKLVIASGI